MNPSLGDNDGRKEEPNRAQADWRARADWIVAYENHLVRGGPAPAGISQNLSIGDQQRLTDTRRALDALHQAFGKDGALSQQSTSEPPPQLGDFRILREIGRGGMGVVYEAEQISMGRKIALKILPLAAMLDERRLERFKNEIHAAATLDHPHCVPIYAVGEERGVHYYAMKLIRGQSLAHVIDELQNRDTLVGASAARTNSSQQSNGQAAHQLATPAEAVETVRAEETSAAELSMTHTSHKQDYFRKIAKLGADAADALHHAHELGVVHRDIKPGNLLLDASGKVWVADFGLARIEADVGMTMTGDVLGTLRYMSPEQALGKRVLVDHRVDVYSLGATLYELLTLKPAIQGGDQAQILKQFTESEPTALQKIDRSIPVELETIITKAMETSPTERYETAAKLADDLRRFLANEPILAKRSTMTRRTAKWVRRYPVLTALISVVLLSVSALSIGALWYAKKIEQHANQLEIELAVNERLRIAAISQQAQTRRAKYLADMRLANHLLLDGFPDAAGTRLKQYLPPSPDAVECDFPWYYLWEEYRRSFRHFHGHSRAVTSFAIAEKADLLISCSHDKTVRFFNLRDNTEVARITDFAGYINAVALTPDEQVLFIGADSGVLVAWDISSVAGGGEPEKLATLEGHTADVFSLAISPDGTHLATAGADEHVLVWELPAMRQVSSLEGHTEWVRCLDFSPDGETLASISHDTNLILWDLHEATEKKRIKIADGRQMGLSVRFHPNGQFIAAGNSHGEVRLIRLSDSETVSFSSGHKSWFRSLDFSDDGHLLAVSGNTPFIRLFRVDTQMQITPWRTLPGHQRETWCVRFADSSRSLFSCGLDGTTVVRNIVGSETTKDKAISYLADNDVLGGELRRRRLTTSRGHDKLLLAGKHAAWLFDAGDLQNPIELATSPKGSIYGGAISSDGRRVGLVRRDHIEIRTVGQSSQTVSLSLNPGAPDEVRFSSLALHPLKDTIAVGTIVGQLSMVNVPSKEILAEFRPFGFKQVSDVLYSSDGRFVAACFCKLHESAPAIVVVWNAISHAECGRIEGVERLLAVSPHDCRLALANREQSIQIWSIDTQTTVMTLEGHADRVISADFSPDGKYLATSAISGPMKLWSLETGQLVLDIDLGLRIPQIVFGPGNSAFATDIEILSREPKLDYRHRLVPLLEEHSMTSGYVQRPQGPE